MMRRLLLIACLVMTGLTAVWSQGEEPMQQVVERGLNRAAFLPLGLSATDPFWSAPYSEWTSRKAWKGNDVGADHAIR